MKINTRDLTLVNQELSALTGKQNWTKQDERRNAFLLSASASIRAGASLAELDEQYLNDQASANGLPQTRIRKSMSEKRRAKALFMRDIVSGNAGGHRYQGAESRNYEFRTEQEGNMTTALGTYTGLGSFVPTDFFAEVKASLVDHDCLFDEDVVSVINSSNGHPIQMGNFDDGANEATIVGEGSDQTGNMVNLGNPGQVKLGVYSFRAPIHKFSVEIFQDLEESYGAYKLFEKFASDRMARGIGNKLLRGSGTGEPTGLVNALETLGAPQVVAGGAGANDGTSTAANSIGSADYANLWGSINRSYRDSSKCVWIMNKSTLTAASAIVTKMGLPLVSFRDGADYILGHKVCVSPSMDSIGRNLVPVIFGDASYWYTRMSSDPMTRLRILNETYAELGLVGIQMFQRAGGVLNYTGAGTNSPMGYMVIHS